MVKDALKTYISLEKRIFQNQRTFPEHMKISSEYFLLKSKSRSQLKFSVLFDIYELILHMAYTFSF